MAKVFLITLLLIVARYSAANDEINFTCDSKPFQNLCDCPDIDDLRLDMNVLKQDVAMLKRKMLENKGYYKAENGMYYKFYEDALTHGQAQTKCLEHGGALASAGLRDPMIRNYMKNTLIPKDMSSWIGLESEKEKHFMWLDGVKSDRSNTDWHINEPDGTGEQCGAMLNTRDHQVADVPCEYTLGYLCEVKI